MIFTAVILAVGLSSCRAAPPADSGPAPSAPPVLSTSTVPFYENLSLSDGEDVIILDVAQDAILLHVFQDYMSDDVHYREEGYNSKTTRLLLYQFSTQKILQSISVPDNCYCTDGFLWDASSFVVTLLHSEPTEAYQQYDIVSYDGADPTVLTSGPCIASGYIDPRLAPLGAQQFAYTYFDPQTKQFGVNIVSRKGEVVPQLTLTEDGSTEHLGTKITSDGARYLYYAAVNGAGTVYVGTPESIASHFTLSDTERVYEFCFWTEDLLLFTMKNTAPDGTASTNFVVKTMRGETVFRHPSDLLFRLISNGRGTALGINANYVPYFIYPVSSSDLQISPVPDMSAVPCSFYALDDHTYFAHVYQSLYLKDQPPGLTMITIQ